MSANAAILASREGGDGAPAIVYRWAGDRAILVEYGPMEVDLGLSFFALAVNQELAGRAIDGLLDLAPGFRSLLVSYDAARLTHEDVLRALDDAHTTVRSADHPVLASRRIVLPIAFDDSQSRRAVERYSSSIRADCPNCVGGSNIDYIVRYNGMSCREELYELLTSAEFFTAFMGFFPGLPFMLPLDPRHTISAPKYNPTRTWTPEGAVGVGGPSFSIYPVESAGGYQLFGRSMPIYDSERRNPAFHADPILLRAGDRLRFRPISEVELEEARRDERFEYEIHDGTFDVAGQLRAIAELEPEAVVVRARRERAAAETPPP
jgi:allophanate hydrolase subunit 1